MKEYYADTAHRNEKKIAEHIKNLLNGNVLSDKLMLDLSASFIGDKECYMPIKLTKTPFRCYRNEMATPTYEAPAFYAGISFLLHAIYLDKRILSKESFHCSRYFMSSAYTFLK